MATPEAGDRPKLSVVIPVYNERATIEEVLRRVSAVPIDKEIIVVDDGSDDGTAELLERFSSRSSQPHQESVSKDGKEGYGNVRVLFQERNRGKGAALRRGFQAARGEIVIVQDADLEYDPRDYPQLLDPIERGVADVVYGSRFMAGPHRVLLFWHYVANKTLTTLSNMLTNLNLSDVWTGYKAFRKEVLDTIALQEDRFGFEPEITAKIAEGGWRIYEVGISYYGRTYQEGKKITWKDGVRGIWCILRYNWFS
ncbi:MAG TPA: glycosyltransferase family 2 protein [Nitrospiraceae bacterium]|jgi:glycosyltransferase involved in cell wall biosynthesis|nr:glycosyltransferase family 2 protein [Nitrospiraceae bacterium]